MISREGPAYPLRGLSPACKKSGHDFSGRIQSSGSAGDTTVCLFDGYR